MLSGLRSQKISYILHVKLDVLKNIYMLLYNVRKMKVVNMLVILYFVFMERQRARCLYKNESVIDQMIYLDCATHTAYLKIQSKLINNKIT